MHTSGGLSNWPVWNNQNTNHFDPHNREAYQTETTNDFFYVCPSLFHPKILPHKLKTQEKKQTTVPFINCKTIYYNILYYTNKTKETKSNSSQNMQS